MRCTEKYFLGKQSSDRREMKMLPIGETKFARRRSIRVCSSKSWREEEEKRRSIFSELTRSIRGRWSTTLTSRFECFAFVIGKKNKKRREKSHRIERTKENKENKSDRFHSERNFLFDERTTSTISSFEVKKRREICEFLFFDLFFFSWRAARTRRKEKKMKNESADLFSYRSSVLFFICRSFVNDQRFFFLKLRNQLIMTGRVFLGKTVL